MNSQNPTTVFYDGLCPICSREVGLYKKLDVVGNVNWRDLRSAESLVAENFSYQAAMDLLHVKDSCGVLHIGMQAHLHMWAQLPYFRHLAALLRVMPTLTCVLDTCYVFFTRYRPGLVREADDGVGKHD